MDLGSCGFNNAWVWVTKNMDVNMTPWAVQVLDPGQVKGWHASWNGYWDISRKPEGAFMKSVISFGLTLALFAASHAAQADEIVAQTTDATAGGALGLSTGVMLGGAAGGPLGALVGAGVGLFMGKGVQAASGLEERAYVVRDNSGAERVVRSPNATFAVGQQVGRQGARLRAIDNSDMPQG